MSMLRVTVRGNPVNYVNGQMHMCVPHDIFFHWRSLLLNTLLTYKVLERRRQRGLQPALPNRHGCHDMQGGTVYRHLLPRVTPSP